MAGETVAAGIRDCNPSYEEEHAMNNHHVKLTYTANGDYFIPDIAFSEAASNNLGKYGRMRKKYLQEHRPGLFNRLALSEKLHAHCAEIDVAARSRIDAMLPRLAEAAGATEELKASDPLKWIGLMNTCKAQAEEVIFDELIYN